MAECLSVSPSVSCKYENTQFLNNTFFTLYSLRSCSISVTQGNIASEVNNTTQEFTIELQDPESRSPDSNYNASTQFEKSSSTRSFLSPLALFKIGLAASLFHISLYFPVSL